MCGICGVVTPDGADRSTLRAMADAIAHRGPDDEGFLVDGAAGLANRRLSIIDVAGGHQPISNEDGSVWVVQNGEIYNYRALREELQRSGHRFATASDTEVIVHLYEELGERLVERLDGMFAIAVWDARRHKLVLARDRLGQKPLYYTHAAGRLAFASEIKALLAAEPGAPGVDLESVHHYLSLRFVPSPRTLFQGIRKLPPAHRLVFQDGNVEIERYWDVDFENKLSLRDDEYVELVRERLGEAVRTHLVSDVQVGALLSGGMDSSVIVALMSAGVPPGLPTFSIGVTDSSFDERPHARLVAERYGTDHHEEQVGAEALGRLPRIVWHLDEPSDPIAVCMFHAARLAARHVKVVLGGDGGDELFAGFDRYLGVARLSHARLVPRLLREKLLAPLVAALPETFSYKSLTQKLRWVGQMATEPSDAARYAKATVFFRFSHEEKRRLFTERMWRGVSELDSTDVIETPFNAPSAASLIDRMLYADYQTRLPEHSLQLVDRMSMAHGLEARSPFLDHHLVETVARLPSEVKVRGTTLKWVLRELSEDLLPEPIVKRPKQGFMLPVADWLVRDMSAAVEATLRESRLVSDGIVRWESVRELIDEHRRHRRDNHVRIWMLLNLEIWLRLFVERRSPEQVEEGLLAAASR